MRDLRVVHRDYGPPFGDAEPLSLKVICQKSNIPLVAEGHEGRG